MMIRFMTIDDYDEVYSLWLYCEGMGLNNIDDSRDGIKRFLNRNPSTCFVAVINSQIVGVIMAGNDGRRGYIYHTAVLPDFRKKGIATALVNKVINAMDSLNISKVSLVVFEHNHTGNEFWKQNGFKQRRDLIYRDKSISEIIRIDT